MLQVNNQNPYTSTRGLSLRLDYREESNLRRLGKAERLSSGALRLKANLTRTGVLEYDTGNELRPDSEVFDPESLESLRSAPVVVGHPLSGEVTLDTYRQLSVGHVESVHRDGQFVTGTIIINDKHTIDMLENGDLLELSPGYTSKVERRTGKGPDGKSYTGVQKLIRYNHVALIPEGQGRSGSEVRVRNDSRSLRTDSLSLRARAIAAGWTDDDFAKLARAAELAKVASDHQTQRQDQHMNTTKANDTGTDYAAKLHGQISNAWQSSSHK